ncbi:MAG: hypothetical protein ACYTG6_16175, partial [Planctomycetota bacterium]
MLGSAAASVVAGIGLAWGGGGRRGPVREMTLAEFNALEGPDIDRVLSKVDCTSLSCCHEKVRDEMGIWIPELV